MSGLTPQMLAAIQAAGQAGAGVTGNGVPDTTINAAMNNSLANSGMFTPNELSAVSSAWNTTGNWGSGAPSPSAWDSLMQQQIGGALGNQAAVGQFTPNPNTPNAQAIAGGYDPLQPAYLQQPGMLNATTVDPQYAQAAGYSASGYNPALGSASGYNPASTGAAGYQGQGYGPSTLSSGLVNSLGANNTIGALLNSVAPQYQQQDQQMMQMLATSGLSPSSTAGQTAFNNLAQQQLAGISPAMASAIQNSQANQLNAGQYNSGVLNTAGQYNSGVQNTANQYNAGNQQQALLSNQAAQNAAGQYNAGNQQAMALANQGALNSAGQFNAGAQNAAGQYNAGNQQNANQFNASTGNAANQYNAGVMNAAAGTNLQNQNNQQLYNANAYNTAGNDYFNAMTGAYNNNANAFNALNNAGLSGAQGIAGQQVSGGNQLASGQQSQFPVYSNPFSGAAASSFGSAGSYPQPQTTNNYYNTGSTTSPYGSYDPTGGVM